MRPVGTFADAIESDGVRGDKNGTLELNDDKGQFGRAEGILGFGTRCFTARA